MTMKVTIRIVSIVMTICICSLGCASRSAMMGDRGKIPLGQEINAHAKSPEVKGDPIEVKGWGILRDLPSLLEKRGYSIVRDRPVYIVEADLVKSEMGPGIGGQIAWDILMAIPSIVLPVPLMGTSTYTLDITISDGPTGDVLSQTRKTFDYRLTGYSLWGLMFGVLDVQDDITEVAAIITDEELEKFMTKSNL